MYFIHGIKRKKGVYEGKPYDNTFIGSLDFDTQLSSVTAGADVDIQKVKSVIWDAALKDYNLTTDESALGLSVTYIYDRYQNVVSVILSEGEEVK